VHIAATKNSTKCNLVPKLLEHKSNSLTYPTTTTQQTNILVKQKPLTPQPNSKQNTTQTQKPTNSRIEKKGIAIRHNHAKQKKPMANKY